MQAFFEINRALKVVAVRHYRHREVRTSLADSAHPLASPIFSVAAKACSTRELFFAIRMVASLRSFGQE